MLPNHTSLCVSPKPQLFVKKLPYMAAEQALVSQASFLLFAQFISATGPSHLPFLLLGLSSPLICLPILHVSKVTSLERHFLTVFSRVASSSVILYHTSVLFPSEHFSVIILFLFTCSPSVSPTRMQALGKERTCLSSYH